MSFVDIMHAYFRGEKLEALFFIVPLGACLVIFGAVILKVERTGFGLGAAIPAIALGLLLCVIGLVVGLRTSGQVAELDKGYRDAPVAMVASELPRMEAVNKSFRTMFIAFGVTAVVGLGLIYLVRKEWSMGLGATLVLAAGIGLLIDGFASRRAVPYTQALEDLATGHDQTLPMPAAPAPD